MEKKIYELTVDPELERVAPPIKYSEFECLKTDLMEHGCVAPLVVWNNVIVDGHNRYRICRENGIPFGIEEMEFADRTEAKLWIVKNQLGRRNLTPFQKCEMVLPLEAELKTEAEKRRVEALRKYRHTGEKSGRRPKTGQVLANMAGLSVCTMFKARTIFEIGDEETKRRLRAGEISINYAYNTLTNKQPVAKPHNELSDAAYMIAALIDDLKKNELDKATVISILTDVSEMLEKR